MRQGHAFLTRAGWALALSLVAAMSLHAASWKQIGGTGIAAGFAGPVGRPVQDAWFSANGRRLYASLQDGTLWVSEDAGLTWTAGERDEGEFRATLDLQETAKGSALVFHNPYRSGVAYALGEHLYRSDDGGGEWTNLTAIGSESVIGRWQAVLAISPADPELIVVGNSMGLWKSFDAGTTWASLNAGLPNFPATRFHNESTATSPTLQSKQLGTLDLIRTARGAIWRASAVPQHGSAIPRSELPRSQAAPLLPPHGYEVSRRVWKDGKPISGDLTECGGQPECVSHSITALAFSGRLWAGTSNGRIWVSSDAGTTWSLAWTHPREDPVASLWANPGMPTTALALAGGRILRSTNGGTSWFDISANLPESDWTAVEGHPSAGTAFVSGPLGVYFSRVDLRQPGPAGAWTRISGNLPEAAVGDLALDPLRGRLYAALPGYGVYWTRTPHVEQALRVLSAADLKTRPAAPGSLLTVLGARAMSVRADGRPAPILDSGADRTQLQVPFAVGGRSLRLQLDSDGKSHVVDLPLQDVSPAVFVVSGEPLILDAGTGALVSWSHPARPGGNVLVMATGLGEVVPPWPAGVPSREIDPPRTVARVEATVGDTAVEVVGAHLAPGFVGIYVVEIAVPYDARPGGIRLSLQADGKRSNDVDLIIGR